MDRCVEMWFDGPEEWYHCAVENTASFKKPEWAEYDNFPYLAPTVPVCKPVFNRYRNQ